MESCRIWADKEAPQKNMVAMNATETGKSFLSKELLFTILSFRSMLFIISKNQFAPVNAEAGDKGLQRNVGLTKLVRWELKFSVVWSELSPFGRWAKGVKWLYERSRILMWLVVSVLISVNPCKNRKDIRSVVH